MESFHDHGIMVPEGVAEEWLKRDDNDLDYQELKYFLKYWTMLILRVIKETQRIMKIPHGTSTFGIQ